VELIRSSLWLESEAIATIALAVLVEQEMVQ
jgi:hypothetical protein